MKIKKNKIPIDQIIKIILREKPVLSVLMKELIEEYSPYSLREIEQCIEPQGDVPLHSRLTPGHRNENNEDYRSIYFDSLVYASLPQDHGKIAMIINLEAQGVLKGKSHVLSRGNYYTSRNISMQVGKFFDHGQYDDIVKVVSIWIVFNAPKHKQNCINRYRMVEEHIIGNACEEEKYFDKQQILVLYLGYKESEYISMNILRILADNGMDYETKNEALEKYDIRLKGGLAKEVRSMCDYGDYVEKMGTEKGIAQGLQRGILQGKEEERLVSLSSLMKNMKIDLHEAMKLLNIPESEYHKYMELMNHS